MSRALLIIRDDTQRNRAIEWCRKAPEGTRIEFKESKRTGEQNDRFWAMLTDVATQKLHFGRKYPADVWKLLFMDALGREAKFVPALDGTSVVPVSYSSSDLSKAEMTELMEFIAQWGTENGIVFYEPTQEASAR